MTKTLIALTGPTAVGKTALSLAIAERFKCDIISSDSRQIYRSIPIATAAPSDNELQRAKHHFVGELELNDYFSAGHFETKTLALLDNKFQTSDIQLMAGGSMMYVDAVCKGIDDIPAIDPELRRNLAERLKNEGLESLRMQLKMLDPQYYATVDLQNPKRIVHGLEVCLMTGQTFTSFRTRNCRQRPFEIVKIGLNRDRTELYDRINTRVDRMMELGLEEEAQKVYPLRAYNSLNTVGLKEMFAWFDGTLTRSEAIEQIKRNTRIYARKQLTWFKRDTSMTWFHPDAIETVIDHIKNTIKQNNN